MFARERERPAEKDKAVPLSAVPESKFSFGPGEPFTAHFFHCVVPQNDPKG